MDAWPRFRPTRLLQRLAAHGVDFVVVGGIAAIAHGGTRLTNDLDICYATDRANLERLGEVLEDLGAVLRGAPDDVPSVPDASALRRAQLLKLDTAEGPIDLLTAPDGAPGYAILKRRAEPLEIDDVTALVASLEDLVAMKRASGREKDRLDLTELEAIRRLRRGAKPRSPED